MNMERINELATLFCNPLGKLAKGDFHNLLGLENEEYQLFLSELDRFQKPEEIAARKKNMKIWLSQGNQDLSQLESKLFQLESETFQNFVKEKIKV